jgi:hypothetical protein
MTDNDFWRGEEANDARQQLAQLRLARLARLDSAIEFYKNDGYITRKEFDALLRDYGDVISASDLRVRVGVVIRDNTEQTLGLEPAVAQRIRANLAFLGEDSLYTLLRWEASKGVNPSVQPLGPLASRLI